MTAPFAPTPDMVACDNCGFSALEDDPRWAPPSDLLERLEPGGEVPAAECPACGCLAYLVDPTPTSTDGLIAFLRAWDDLDAAAAAQLDTLLRQLRLQLETTR